MLTIQPMRALSCLGHDDSQEHSVGRKELRPDWVGNNLVGAGDILPRAQPNQQLEGHYTENTPESLPMSEPTI